MTDVRTVVQLVVLNNEGDSCYRMRWPGEQIAEQEPAWRVINLDVNAAERFAWCLEADLLVLYVPNEPDMLELVARRRALGRCTLVEYNDNFYAPPPASPAAEAWSSPLLWQSYEAFMAAADALVVTGPGLQQLLQDKCTAALHIIENHLPAPPPSFDRARHEQTGEIRLGWAGSLGHIADILSVKRVLERLLHDYPQLVFCAMGNKSIPQELGLPPERMRFQHWGSMDEYLGFLSSLHIGIAPLLPTPYNECRSDIKAVEIASRSALPLLTEALPYRAFLDATGLKAINSPEEFEQLARRYIEDPSHRLKDARACYDYVSERRVGVKRHERLELYRRLLPTSPAAFDWGLPAGYHEVFGKKSQTTPFQQMSANLQQLLRSRRWQEAAGTAAQALERYPGNPDIALLAVRCLVRSQPATAVDRLQHLRWRFSDDLRFPLMQAALAGTAETRSKHWREILSMLEGRNIKYHRFFREMLVGSMLKLLQKDEDFGGLAEELLKFYPRSAHLRYELARHFERRRMDDKALLHFDWLVAEERDLKENTAFYQSLSRGYLASWQEALAGREVQQRP